MKKQLTHLIMVIFMTMASASYSQGQSQTNNAVIKVHSYRKLDPEKDGFKLTLKSADIEMSSNGTCTSPSVDVIAIGTEPGIKDTQVTLVNSAPMTDGKVDTKTYGVIGFSIESTFQISEIRVTDDTVTKIRAALQTAASSPPRP